MECIRRVKKGKQKEIRLEDLLIDFDNQEASKPLVSNKSTGSKSSTHKKYEEYGTAGSSGLTHNEKATPVVTVGYIYINCTVRSAKLYCTLVIVRNFKCTVQHKLFFRILFLIADLVYLFIIYQLFTIMVIIIHSFFFFSF